jgi:hypothetical protein
MRRPSAVALLALVTVSGILRADPFDLYDNKVLGKAPDAAGVRAVKELTPSVMSDHDRVLPGITGSLLVVRTNDGRWSKLLVQPARQKIADGKSVPILLVDRFVTYKEGTDEAVQASGRNLYLFAGSRLNLDVGQVVPEEAGGDLRLVADGNKVHVEALGKAKLYLLTRPLPDAQPKKTNKLVVGGKFLPEYFNGTYRLYDDGRRSGRLTLKVEEGGDVTGEYVSDRDGEKYEVRGRIGQQPHGVQFTVKFPRVEQQFQGWLFTGDGTVLTGSSRMLEREAGFYAVRLEDR